MNNSSASSHLVQGRDSRLVGRCDWPNNEMEDGVTISRVGPVFLARSTLSLRKDDAALPSRGLSAARQEIRQLKDCEQGEEVATKKGKPTAVTQTEDIQSIATEGQQLIITEV